MTGHYAGHILREFRLNVERGFSLIEVMVAGAVTATGLAGVTALLMSSVINTSVAEQRTIAALQARQLADMMALTPQAMLTYLADPPAITADCAAATCDVVQFAEYNQRIWRIAVATYLPGGRGLVCRDATPDDGTLAEPGCDGTGPMVIKLFWNDGRDEPDNVHRFAMTVAQ